VKFYQFLKFFLAEALENVPENMSAGGGGGAHLIMKKDAQKCDGETANYKCMFDNLRNISTHLISETGRSVTPMLGARKYIPAKQSRCKDIANLWLPCTCQYQVCIGWYPCGLKYCRGKDQAGKPFSYRCGIKTCRKCRLFEYAVKFKHYCLWDN
jgi:hypothetical protein